MSPEVNRRNKPSRKFTLLIVPRREGRPTRSLTLGRWTLWGGICAVLFGIAALTLAALVYTPLGSYVHIPNPELERKYGSQLHDTQAKLERLTEDVLLLRDYNNQLRKALGGAELSDSGGFAGGQASSIFSATTGVTNPMAVVQDTGLPQSTDDTTAGGGYDEGSALEYQAVVTNPEGFRAVFPILQPTEGFVTQAFDPTRGHHGVDFAAKRGTAVYAATDGYVLFSGWTYNDGNMIILTHGSGYLTVYKHNQSLLRSEPGYVRRGEIIALLGDTGKTSGGPHLHFELWKDGTPVDPQEFMLSVPVVQ